MIILKNYITVLLLGLMLSFSKESNAQCLNDAWAWTGTLYNLNDIVSDVDGNDWICHTPNQSYRQPSGSSGNVAWTLLNNPCEEPSAPNVAATLVRANYCTTSFGVGTVNSNSGSTIISRGFVYGTTSNPNLEDDLVLLDASTAVGDEFEGLMEDLTPETDYYVRTFATNSEGATYGTEASFTTRALAECASDCDLACDISDPSLLDGRHSSG